MPEERFPEGEVKKLSAEVSKMCYVWNARVHEVIHLWLPPGCLVLLVPKRVFEPARFDRLG